MKTIGMKRVCGLMETCLPDCHLAFTLPPATRCQCYKIYICVAHVVAPPNHAELGIDISRLEIPALTKNSRGLHCKQISFHVLRWWCNACTTKGVLLGHFAPFNFQFRVSRKCYWSEKICLFLKTYCFYVEIREIKHKRNKADVRL